MFGMAERASDAEEVKSLRDQIIAELVRHSVAEEQFLTQQPADTCLTGTSLPITRSKSMPRPSGS